MPDEYYTGVSLPLSQKNFLTMHAATRWFVNIIIA